MNPERRRKGSEHDTMLCWILELGDCINMMQAQFRNIIYIILSEPRAGSPGMQRCCEPAGE